jgi:hypothetical protein
MKELRGKVDERHLRVLFAFDSRSTALLLLGGDKTGDPKWYDTFVPVADTLFDQHMAALNLEQEQKEHEKKQNKRQTKKQQKKSKK